MMAVLGFPVDSPFTPAFRGDIPSSILDWVFLFSGFEDCTHDA